MYNMSATKPTVHGTVSDELPPPQSPQSPFVHVRVRGCTPVPHDELHGTVSVHVVHDRGVPDLVSNSNTCHALTDEALLGFKITAITATTCADARARP